MTQPRVLFVGAFPPPSRAVFGGMVSSCRALLQSSFPERVDLRTIDTTQRSHPPPGLATRLVWASRRFAEYVRAFEAERPDAVLLFAAIGASLVDKSAMAWYARIRGVPALMFPRGGALIEQCAESAAFRAWVRILLGGSSMLLCQSERWHVFGVEEMGFEDAAAPVIPNWTATPELLAIGIARVREPRHSLRFLFLGWLEKEKGIGELLEAAAGLKAHEFTLCVVGDGRFRAEAERRVGKMGLGKQVAFTGWLQGAALSDALAQADVLVLPSWAEGLPNAMVEAMAAGLAVVVSRVGSVPDVIVDNENGLLVPARDAVALKGAMSRLLGDPQLVERLGVAAHKTARELFGVERAVSAILRGIERAVEHPRPLFGPR